MPKFKITDPTTGKSFIVTGDAPPTEDEANQIFGSVGVQPNTFDALLNSPGSHFIRDAVVDPALGLATPVTKMLGQGYMSDALKGAQRAIDSRFDLAAARGRNTPGYPAARARMEADANATGRGHGGAGGFIDQMLAPVAPAAVGTLALLSGGGVDASNAAQDTQYAAQAGYQQEHPVLSGAAALAPAAVTLGRAAIPAAGRAIRSLIPKAAKTIDALRATVDATKRQATAAYSAVNQSGMKVAPTALNDMLNDIYATHVNGAPVVKPGMNTTLYPKSASVLGELQTASGSGAPLSLTDLAELRQSAGDVAADYSAASADRMRAHVIKDGIDRFVTNLTPNQMHIQNAPVPGQSVGALIQGVTPQVDATAIKALNDARGLWARQAQGGEMLRIIEKARNDAGSNFAQAGFEQALRRRFKNLANNDNAWRSLSPDMQKAVMAVNDGGPMDTVLRKIGAFAPQGKLMQMGEGSALVGSVLSGDPLLMAGAIGVPAAGQIARTIGTARTLKRATDVVDLALAGGRARNLPTLPSRGLPQMPPLSPRGLFGSAYLLNQRQPQPAQ